MIYQIEKNFVLLVCLIFSVTFLIACEDEEETTSSPSVTPISYSIGSSGLNGAKYIGSHDTEARTVSFTHNADSVECSHDNGVNFSSCDSNTSVVFTEADLSGNNTIVIRFNKSGVTSETVSIEANSLFSGVTVLSCDTVFTSNKTQTEIEAVFADDTNICLAAGITVNGSATTAITLANHEVNIIGTASNPPTIHYIVSTADTANTDVNRLVNLTLSPNSTQNDHSYTVSGKTSVLLSNVTASNVDGSILYTDNSVYPDDPILSTEMSTLTTTNTNTIYVEHSGWHRASVLVDSSTIVSSGGSPVYMNGDYVGSLTVQNGSVLRSTSTGAFDSGISLGRAQTMTITDSTIEANGADTIRSYNLDTGTATFTITDSVIISNKYSAIWVDKETNVNLTNVEFRKETASEAQDSSLFRVDGASSNFNDISGNVFCHVNAATASFTSFLSGSDGTHGGSLSDPTGALTVCN